jgi:hypothetical protein
MNHAVLLSRAEAQSRRRPVPPDAEAQTHPTDETLAYTFRRGISELVAHKLEYPRRQPANLLEPVRRTHWLELGR